MVVVVVVVVVVAAVELISRRGRQPHKTPLRVIDSIIFLLLVSGGISVSTAMPL